MPYLDGMESVNEENPYVGVKHCLFSIHSLFAPHIPEKPISLHLMMKQKKKIQRDCESVFLSFRGGSDLPLPIQVIMNKTFILSVDLTNDSCKKVRTKQYQIKAILERPSRRSATQTSSLTPTPLMIAGSQFPSLQYGSSSGAGVRTPPHQIEVSQTQTASQSHPFSTHMTAAPMMKLTGHLQKLAPCIEICSHSSTLRARLLRMRKFILSLPTILKKMQLSMTPLHRRQKGQDRVIARRIQRQHHLNKSLLPSSHRHVERYGHITMQPTAFQA